MSIHILINGEYKRGGNEMKLVYRLNSLYCGTCHVIFDDEAYKQYGPANKKGDECPICRLKKRLKERDMK